LTDTPPYRSGLFFPRLLAVLPLTGNRMKDPETLARSYVEPADVPFHIGFPARHATRPVRGADHDNISSDERGRVQADLARRQVDELIVALFQIDDAVGAERGDAGTGLRVEGDQSIPRRDVQDAFLF